MKNDLIKRLMPFVETFVDSLLKVEDSIQEKVKELEREIEKAQSQQNELRVQKNENVAYLNSAKDKLAEERIRQVGLNGELSKEISKYGDLKNDYGRKLAEIEENLKSSRTDKEMVANALERAAKKSAEYNTKTELLKKDEIAQSNKDIELSEKEKNLNIKEKLLNKQAEENASRSSYLNDFDLKLKAREKEVQRLIKRYELEKFIKDN